MADKDTKEKEQTQTQAQADVKGMGIDPKYLKGFMFRGAKPKAIEEDGRKKTKYIPFERPLEPGDVMSFKDYGATIVVATKDGRKYTVKKGGE
jgi:hypothetical protein